jgi:hypothetical protein
MVEKTTPTGTDSECTVKRKKVLCLTKHYVMKAYGGSGCIETNVFLPQDQLEMSGQLQTPATLPFGTVHGTHWIGGGVGSRASLVTSGI